MVVAAMVLHGLERVGHNTKTSQRRPSNSYHGTHRSHVYVDVIGAQVGIHN